MKPVVLLSEPETRPDLKWVEEVAALLPEEARLGWYQNVRPWLRMLPPDDKVAHLAYSMGYLPAGGLPANQLVRSRSSHAASEATQPAALPTAGREQLL
jgi:hypothetical protein